MLGAILAGLAAVIALVLLIAALMPKKYALSSTVAINRPQATVFEYVRHLKNQRYYSKWVMADPDLNLVYSGTDGEPGFISSWRSNMKSVGEGAQEIIEIFPGEGYKAELRFEKPFKSISQAEIRTYAENPNSTRVTTTFYSSMPFPFNALAPLMKKMLLRDMNENSANLKRELEQAG